MANCKFCGKPVKSAPIFHSDCWKAETSRMAEKFCDDYCRIPRECADEDELQEQHCNSCALVKVLNLGL